MLRSAAVASQQCSTSGRTHCWQPCITTKPHPSRRIVVRSTAYEPQVTPPPPPPPPPPPQPPQQSRRSLLVYVGGGAAALAAVAAGSAALRGGSSEDKQERAAIDAARAEGGFKREYDGHVWLQSRDGAWLEVRLDAKVPGGVLLRDPNNYVYTLTFNGVQQIDLTDDYVVMALFGDGNWEGTMQRLQAKDDTGDLVDVRLDSEAFRDLISILD